MLYRDMGVVNDTLYADVHHNTSFLRVDFSQYFTFLQEIGEQRKDDSSNEVDDGVLTFDEGLWE